MKKAVVILSILLVLCIGIMAAVYIFGTGYINGKNSEIAELTQQVAEGTRNGGELDSRLSESSAELEAKQEEIDRLNDAADEQAALIEELKAQQSALEERISGMAEEFRSSDAETLAGISEARSDAAKRFVLALQDKGLGFTGNADADNGSEVIYVSDLSGSTYAGPAFKYSISVRFPNDVNSAYFRISDFMEYDPQFEQLIIERCNYINTSMNIKCVYDDVTHTLSLYYDLALTDSPLDTELLSSALSSLTEQVRFIYDMVKPYLPLPSFDYSALEQAAPAVEPAEEVVEAVESPIA